MCADRGHGLDHDGFYPDGEQTRVGDDQRGAVTIAGLAPERLAFAQVGVDLFEPAASDHHGDDLFRGGTMQPLGQRHRKIVGALSGRAEDDGLRVGEFGHLSLRPDRAARHCAAFHRGKPAALAGRVIALSRFIRRAHPRQRRCR
jgi:hypothetical protein